MIGISERNAANVPPPECSVEAAFKAMEEAAPVCGEGGVESVATDTFGVSPGDSRSLQALITGFEDYSRAESVEGREEILARTEDRFSYRFAPKEMELINFFPGEERMKRVIERMERLLDLRLWGCFAGASFMSPSLAANCAGKLNATAPNQHPTYTTQYLALPGDNNPPWRVVTF